MTTCSVAPPSRFCNVHINNVFLKLAQLYRVWLFRKNVGLVHWNRGIIFLFLRLWLHYEEMRSISRVKTRILVQCACNSDSTRRWGTLLCDIIIRTMNLMSYKHLKNSILILTWCMCQNIRIVQLLNVMIYYDYIYVLAINYNHGCLHLHLLKNWIVLIMRLFHRRDFPCNMDEKNKATIF
jgi:hypothetical protein